MAYLYIPPKTANVRGIVVGQFNMLELPILEHPKFRETLQKLDFAAVWIAPSLFGADFNFKDAGKAAAVGKMFEDLAELSGCRELATAPLVGIGHSAMANFPWELAARKPERALAGISYDGTFASQAGTLNENDLKRLEGVFLDRVPQGRAERWSGKKAGEAIAHGSDAERIQIFPICGPVVRIDNETMAVRFNRFGFTSSRRTGEIYMIAVYPGDDTYRRIVQQSVMMIPHRNTKGVAQRIEFPEIPDQRVGTNSVTLQARANTGMPVAYYVEYGPAYLKDNELIFTEIPAGAKFPVEVSVVAYQYGNAGKPQLQSANPVTRRFRIVK